MKKDKSPIIRYCVIAVAIILILSTAFIFLAFRTDYVFNIDADSTFRTATFDRTTVTTVIEEINNLEGGGGSLIPDIDITPVEEDWWYCPDSGEVIDVSFGIDAQTEQRAVTSTDTWTLEYSIQGCTNAFGGQLCHTRLMTAVNLFGVNHTESGDLLKLSVDGNPCFAGAMIQGVFNVGDVVLVELDDGTQFNMLILDTKNNQHTASQLGNGQQVQNAWGHGYPVGGDSVQMSICEFICNQTLGGASNAQDLPSGAFLRDRKVHRAKVVMHVDIDNGGTVSTGGGSIPGVPDEESRYNDLAANAYKYSKSVGNDDTTAWNDAVQAAMSAGASQTEAETAADKAMREYVSPSTGSGSVQSGIKDTIKQSIDAGTYSEQLVIDLCGIMAHECSQNPTYCGVKDNEALGWAMFNRTTQPGFGSSDLHALCHDSNQVTGTFLSSYTEYTDTQLQAAHNVLSGQSSNFVGIATSWKGAESGYHLWALTATSDGVDNTVYVYGNNLLHTAYNGVQYGRASNAKPNDVNGGHYVQVYDYSTHSWLINTGGGWKPQ